MLDDDFLDDFIEEIEPGVADADFVQIFEKLESKKCILVLGPELSKLSLSKNGKTIEVEIQELTALMLSKYLLKYNIDIDTSRRKDLQYIAMRCEASNIPELKGLQLGHKVEAFVQNYEERVPNVFSVLASLPFHLVINTSFDHFFSKALGEKAQQAHYNYKRNNPSKIGEITKESPLVYNLFGSYTDPESLVLSKLQQIDFVKELGSNVSKIPLSIKSQIDKNTLFLFLGFDAETWHLPLLFRILDFHEHEVALYYQEGEVSQNTMHVYRDILNFQLKWEAPESVAQRLAESYPKWKAEQSSEVENIKNKARIDYPSPSLDSGKANVLMMTSSPKDGVPLEINKEINTIKEELQLSSNSKLFDFNTELDITKSNISRFLGNYNPAIVHFSGHGTGGHLLFYSEEGYSDEVSGEQLGRVLGLEPSVSCVLLNACYSEQQAIEIANFVPNVIGADNAVEDGKAQQFARFFYRGIFAGKTYLEAFDRALADLAVSDVDSGGAQFVFFQNGEQLR
jgi:hypothetical protein